MSDIRTPPDAAAGDKKAERKPSSAKVARVESMFETHPSRASVLNEVHARPFHPVASPASIFHFAFMTEVGEGADNRDRLVDFLASRGLEPMPDGARHHRFSMPGVVLRWEQHTEFTTYGFTIADPGGAPFDHGPPPAVAELLEDMTGQLLVATRITLRAPSETDARLTPFQSESLCESEVAGGSTVLVTDLKADGAGFTRFLIEDRGLAPIQAGALIQRILEIETYRTLALLGLPEAHKAGPTVRKIEEQLAEVTAEMRETSNLNANRALLDRLTTLAGETEAIVAETSYRFSATTAYEQLVDSRLRAIDETSIGGQSTLAGFLRRRMMPAMRTCRSTEHRLADLSDKLGRAASLLRARVDVELESQNRDLLETMNRRARIQLRLQQTVEGLSVAAVSYYIVGLIAYLAKGVSDAGAPVSAGIVAAAAVPVVIVVIGLMVRRFRRRHRDDDHD